jgi:epoxyqueuosine reductase
LDWWDGLEGTPGNRILIQINNELSHWVEEKLDIKTHKLPYHVEKGGIFLKDSAVMAGLGCMGKNNLLVTPEFGPRIRLRAMVLEAEVEPTGPVQFDPCDGCKEPCRHACPQKARLQGTVQTRLPPKGLQQYRFFIGRNGDADPSRPQRLLQPGNL